MANQPLSFRLADLGPDLVARAPQGQIGSELARTQLRRYFALLDMELGQVHFTVGECCLLADALASTVWEPAGTVRFLWAAVVNAIQLDGLDRKWDVDAPSLLAKLRSICPGQAMAIIDAIERWWLGRQRWSSYDEGFRAVGLLREPRAALEAQGNLNSGGLATSS